MDKYYAKDQDAYEIYNESSESSPESDDSKRLDQESSNKLAQDFNKVASQGDEQTFMRSAT